MTFESEMSRIAKEIVKNVPLDVQPVLLNRHLNSVLGLKSDTEQRPQLGSLWHKVVLFPNTLVNQVNKKSNSQSNQVTSQGSS